MFPLAGWRDVVLCELHHLCLCERQDSVSQEAVHSSQQLSSSEFFKRAWLSSLLFTTIMFVSASWKCVHSIGAHRLESRDFLAYQFRLVLSRCAIATLIKSFSPLSLLCRLCSFSPPYFVSSTWNTTSLSFIICSFVGW